MSHEGSGTEDGILEYRKQSGQLVLDKTFNLNPSSTSPKGMHYTGELYVADSNADKIFGYVVKSNSRTPRTYVLQDGNNDPTGIWASGHIMWVADEVDNKLYAYEMHPTQAHMPEKDVNGITGNPAGIWSDYDQIYILDSVDYDISGYEMPRRNYSPHVVSGPTEVDYPENSTQRVGYYSAQDPDNRSVSWSLYPSGDHQYFDIGGGYLHFKSPPNYEDPKDTDGDNVYQLVLIATSGEFAHTYFPVKVTVTDVPWEQPYFPDTSPPLGRWRRTRSRARTSATPSRP